MIISFKYLLLWALLHPAHARIITIEEFGGLPDSEIPVEKEPVFHPEFLHSSERAMPLKKTTVLNQNYRAKYKYKQKKASHGKAEQIDDALLEQAIKNRDAFNLALQAATEGDTIQLVVNQSYTFMGGIRGVNLNYVTLDFAAYTRFIYDIDRWPMRPWSGSRRDFYKAEYAPAIDLTDCIGVIVTCSAKDRAIVSVDFEKNEIYLDPESGSNGIIDGHGKRWWNDSILGQIGVETRPRLIHVQSSKDITVEYLTLVNSPYWTLTLEAIGAEVHHVNVLIDRNYQRKLVNDTDALTNLITADEAGMTITEDDHYDTRGSEFAIKRSLREPHHLQPHALGKFHFPDVIPKWILQPQNLNTDGIDPVGQNIYIHDCIVLNDDDSVAVKPPIGGRKGSILNNTIPYHCTQNITVENMVLTGFGASIGSVGPSSDHTCVDNVHFKNIQMPGTGKGIYIKSNKSDCKNGVSSSITNIVYEGVHMKQPIWWPIWIGPQQQHEPHESLGGACSLNYPLDSTICPTQGCTTFENITIKDVLIEDPLLSPGVVLGNSSNPMKNIVFENVTVSVPFKDYLTHGRLPFHTKHFPYSGKYQCENVMGSCKKCNPAPECLEDKTGV